MARTPSFQGAIWSLQRTIEMQEKSETIRMGEMSTTTVQAFTMRRKVQHERGTNRETTSTWICIRSSNSKPKRTKAQSIEISRILDP